MRLRGTRVTLDTVQPLSTSLIDVSCRCIPDDHCLDDVNVFQSEPQLEALMEGESGRLAPRAHQQDERRRVHHWRKKKGYCVVDGPEGADPQDKS